MPIRPAVLTISDKASRGERVDASGAAIAELLATIDAAVLRSEVSPDERAQIAGTLRSSAGVKHTPMAALSRGVAGVRGRCLILNLPGSEKGVRENLAQPSGWGSSVSSRQVPQSLVGCALDTPLGPALCGIASYAPRELT